MRTKEENWEVSNVMFQALDIKRNGPRIADLSWPPPKGKDILAGMNTGYRYNRQSK